MYDEYHSRGLQIIAVPCNQFGAQEPDSNEQVKEWVQENYQIEFPIIEKTDVIGDDAHSVYQNLKEQIPDKDITWNFAKYLINAKGRALSFYEPGVDPENLTSDFIKMLD